MKTKEKQGVAILVIFFLFLGMVLVFSISRPEGPSRSIQDNVLIDQRKKNRSLN